MSLEVSTMPNVRLGDYRWGFLFISFSDYRSGVRDAFEQQMRAFGADLRAAGVVVEPYHQTQSEVAREVLEKPWPTEVRQRMMDASEPVMLVIENDFTDFDPQHHRWAIVWLSDFDPVREDLEARPFLRLLASTALRDEDVIGALHERAERIHRQQRQGQLLRFASRAGSYVEWTPRLPLLGLGIDVKALMRDLAPR